MTKIESTDYHDFVIKNGKLIGEFEQMYQKSRDIPWHQDEQDDWLDVKITIQLLNEYNYFDAVIDLGCGLVYFLSILEKKLYNKKRMIGIDISSTCCKKAKTIFPNFSFYTLNLMGKIDFYPFQKELGEKNLFIIRGTLWYIFPKLKTVIENIFNMLKQNDYLLISQNFPPLTSEFVGKQVISNPNVLLEWMKDRFIIQKSIWLENHSSNDNNNWFISIFLKKYK